MKKNGAGTLFETNGPYVGDWADDLKCGMGKKVFSDRSVYKGEWKANMKHGEGSYVWSDSTTYTGAWKEDKYHGFGVKVSAQKKIIGTQAKKSLGVMEMNIVATGWRTRNMVTVFTPGRMETDTKVTGLMISSTDMASSCGILV